MVYPSLAEWLSGGAPPPGTKIPHVSDNFWNRSFRLPGTPSGDHRAPPQLKDASEEGRLSDRFAIHVGKHDQEICQHTSLLVHSGVEGDRRPDTRAEHTGNIVFFEKNRGARILSQSGL